MAGAWDCYRAVLRMIDPRQAAGEARQRYAPDVNRLAPCSERLATWAADPRTTIPQLRTALEEVRRVPAKARVGCVHTQDGVSGPHAISGAASAAPPPEQIEEEWTYRLGDMAVAAST